MVFCFPEVCKMCAVIKMCAACRSVFGLHLGVIGRLFSVILYIFLFS